MNVMLMVLAFLAFAPRMPAKQSAAADDPRTARTAYDAEMRREGQDCVKAQTTYDMNVCFKSAMDATEKNLSIFYTTLKGLLSSDPESARALEESEVAWTAYRQKSCSAIERFYQGGSIALTASMQCMIQLTRSRMRDLNALYDMPLHH